MFKKNMDILKTILALSFFIIANTGCTIIGNKVGKSLDSGDSTKYEDKYTEKGADADIEVIKAIFFSNHKEPEIDTRACKDPNTRQICTVKKGCWCEET